MSGEKKHNSKLEEFEKSEYIELTLPDDDKESVRTEKKDSGFNDKAENQKAGDKKSEAGSEEKDSEVSSEGKKSEAKEDKKSGGKDDKKSDSKDEKKPEKTTDDKASKKSDDKESDVKGDEKKSQGKSDDKKTNSVDEKQSESKSGKKKPDEKDDKKTDAKKDDKSETKAISQSKRLADVNAAKKEQKDNEGEGNTNEGTQVSSDKKKRKWPIVILCITIVLLLGVYFTGFWYFSSNFYPAVAINGTDVSSMDEPTAKNTLDNFYSAYVLTMNTVDQKEEKIVGKDIDMVITLKEKVSRCLKDQKPYIWFVEIFNKHDFQIDADVTWNQEKLEDIYKKMDILTSKDIVDPVDAYIGLDGKQYVIVDEVMGNRLDEDIFKQKVAEKLSQIQANMDLTAEDCYCKPAVFKDSPSLVEEYEKLGDFKNCVITLKLDDLELEPNIEFLDDVLEEKGNTMAVSETKVNNYVKKLAQQYDTVGTKRKFKTSWGNQYIEIEGKNNIGYIMDQEQTVKDLMSALNDKKPATVDVTFTQKGISLVGDNDIGDTYIEANLSKQKVVAYKDGKKIAESDCVSGCISQGHGTCLGLYVIQAKQSPATLRGEKVPKTRTVIALDEAGNPYETQETTMEYSYESHVTYWMPFNGGYGLHDADGWRYSYGGDIFLYSGSHGCINLPREFAQKLYETFDVGTPVLVYYEDNDDRISKK